MNATKYKIGWIVVIEVIPDGFLEFGKFFNIFANEEQRVLFICEKIVVQSFNEELHAYEVINSYEKTCCLAVNMISPYLAIYHSSADGWHMVSVRHSIKSI